MWSYKSLAIFFPHIMNFIVFKITSILKNKILYIIIFWKNTMSYNYHIKAIKIPPDLKNANMLIVWNYMKYKTTFSFIK